jgi:hypothetical protein
MNFKPDEPDPVLIKIPFCPKSSDDAQSHAYRAMRKNMMQRTFVAPHWSSAAIALSAVLTFAPQGSADAIDRNTVVRDGKLGQVLIRSEPLKRAKTTFIDFNTSPFPFDGMMPGTEKPFLDVTLGERRGHRSSGGRVFWEDETYRDRQVLLHIPKGFDVSRPGVMIVFFHGHGATLKRDVRDRQKVPAQISASGINAVLVAPQFAINAPDSSAGKFWEPGAFGQFIEESGNRLADLHGSPLAAQAFANMPVVIVAYSGGYRAAAWCLDVGGIENRLRGVVLLDALYGQLDKFATWIINRRIAFFVSAYTNSTEQENDELKTLLTEQNVAFGTELNQHKWQHGVTFLSTNPDVKHEYFVTNAWADNPIKDILRRLDEYRRR